MPTTSIAQFFVVVRDAASLELQQVPVTAALQDDLSSEFMDQMSNLLADKRQITFSPSYQPDADELFIIQRYALPSFLQHAVTSPDHFPELQLPFTPNGPIVKAILVAFPPGRGGRPQYLFQHFDRRRILNTQRTLIFRGGEFSRLEDPGVVIGDHLDAVIQGEDLIFHSFRLTSQFLPLHDYFEAATDGDIRDFVSHRLFVDGKSDDVIATANDITRKRISLVLKAGTLESAEATPERLQAAAKKFELDLKLKGRPGKRRVVFPSERSEVRLMLQFLAESLYTGPISGEPYVANSYRRLN